MDNERRSCASLLCWKYQVVVLFLLFSVAFANCSNGSEGYDYGESDYSAASESAMEVEDYQESELRANNGADAPPPPGVERKLLRTARLSLQVDDVAVAAAAVAKTLDALGGYVAAEESNDYEGRYLTMSLRVPSDRLDTMMSVATGLAERVEQRSVAVVDATTQYVDVAARLATQRALAERLGELLAKADVVSDVIEVEREFARVTSDIESFEARLKSIDRQAKYATLDLTLHGERPSAVAGRGFFGRLWDNFTAGAEGVVEVLLIAVAFWPLWIGVALVIWLLRRYRRRRIIE